MKIKYVFFLYFLICSFCVTTVQAQFKIDVFAGVSSNPVDNPPLITIGHSPQFEYHNFFVSYAMDVNLNNRDKKIINAFSTGLGYKFAVKNHPLKTSLFYCYKPVSNILNVNNAGLKIDYTVRKWYFALGNNFNFYKFNNNAAEIYGITDNDVLVEAANLMYSVKYHLREIGSDWNLFINLTNFELFIIEQETNPMLDLGFTYKRRENSPKFFADLWYQTAGFNNIRVNYFGVFFRTGVSWEIK